MIKHELDLEERAEAQVMVDRLLARMGSNALSLKLFLIPTDQRSGRVLIHQGHFMVFSSRNQGGNYFKYAPQFGGVPLEWIESDSVGLAALLKERGASDQNSMTLNPCPACGYFQEHPVASLARPDQALGIWVSDSASRLAKISPALMRYQAYQESNRSTDTSALLALIEWLVTHIDSGMPDLIRALSELSARP